MSAQFKAPKVLVRTLAAPLNAYSGYGRDGVGIVRALAKWGCDVYVEPTYVSPPLPKDVALLLTKHLRAPFDLLIQHADPDSMGISKVAAECSDVKVSWSMWEFSDGRPLSRCSSTFARRIGMFDLSLWYDEVSRDAWAKYGPKRHAHGVLQGGYESSEWKYFGERDWFGDRMQFIMHGQLHNRKSPYITIQAFNELKHEHPDSFAGAKLGLHTTIGDPLVSFGELVPGMKVWHEMWEKDVLEEFYHAGHVLLAPSRGEGKNLPALEMMTTGGTVAATNWGGHTQWLSDDIAYPLDYTLSPTYPERPDCLAHDAKVSVATMKDCMWHVYNNRGEARMKAERAAMVIPALCDWDVVIGKFFERVRALVPDKGELLYGKAMACKREE